jgi:spermidine synthase
MLLNEFFGSINLKNNPESSKKEEHQKIKQEGLASDVFEYIINNDKLHKTVFFPIAEKVIKEATKEQDPKVWMPIVNKGCMEFYSATKMKENPREIFTEEFREELCQKMAEHYNPDIIKGVYNLGK